MFAPSRRAEFVRLMQQDNAVSGFESQAYRQDGSIIWISENARAVYDDSGALSYYEGTVVKILLSLSKLKSNYGIMPCMIPSQVCQIGLYSQTDWNKWFSGQKGTRIIYVPCSSWTWIASRWSTIVSVI